MPRKITWLLVYERGKTGKTFFSKRMDKAREVLLCKKRWKCAYRRVQAYRKGCFFEKIVSEIGSKFIAIDEFHRLGSEFIELLHALGGKGKLVLISSTLWLSKNIFSKESGILGLVYEFPLNLISPVDVVRSLSREYTGKELIEASVYAREPIVARNLEGKV